MGYLHGLEKMGRRKREGIKHDCLAYWLGYWREVPACALVPVYVLSRNMEPGSSVHISSPVNGGYVDVLTLSCSL